MFIVLEMYNFPLVLDCVAFNFPNIKMPVKVRKFVCNTALVGSLEKTVRAGSIALRHHFAPIHTKILWYHVFVLTTFTPGAKKKFFHFLNSYQSWTKMHQS